MVVECHRLVLNLCRHCPLCAVNTRARDHLHTLWIRCLYWFDLTKQSMSRFSCVIAFFNAHLFSNASTIWGRQARSITGWPWVLSSANVFYFSETYVIAQWIVNDTVLCECAAALFSNNFPHRHHLINLLLITAVTDLHFHLLLLLARQEQHHKLIAFFPYCYHCHRCLHLRQHLRNQAWVC